MHKWQHERPKIKCISTSYTKRVKMTHLQHVHFTQPCGSSSRHCWEAHRPRQWHRTLKIECLNGKNVSKAQTIETAYLWHVHVTHPCGNTLNWVHGVYRPSCRCGRTKIELINVSQAQNGKMTYLQCVHAMQPHRSHPKPSYRVIGPKCRCGRLKTRSRNVRQTETDGNAYQGLYKPTQPLPLNLVNPA